MVRESDIESYLVSRVLDHKGEVRKVAWIGRRNAPDRRVMLPTGCCWVELKASGKRATDEQQREHDRMRTHGEKVFVINSYKQVDSLIRDGYV